MKNRLFPLFCALCLGVPPVMASAAVKVTGAPPAQSLPTLGQAEHPARPEDSARKRVLREAAQKKAALSWGAQTGYAHQTELRNRWLIAHAQDLDRIFTFRPFLAENEHVLLPSVDSGRRAFKLENATTSTGTLVSYRISEPARIVSIPPTFRDYLILSPGIPKKVDVLLLPKTGKEKKRWKEWTDRGWKAGEKLSERAFLIGSRRLVRAIEGRIRFYELSLAGQIDRPDWARSPATALRTGEVLEIGDTVLRITRPARFTSSDKWKPLSVEVGK